jgi:8-oxo-dGTP pyrophosphatase MutT (NUDIX family)
MTLMLTRTSLELKRVHKLKHEILALPQHLLSDLDVRQAQDQMLDLLEVAGERAMNRSYQSAHFTASAFICSIQGEVLALFHRKLQRWLQPGGHLEVSDQSSLESALREAREESGLHELIPLGQGPIDLDIHIIPARRQEPEHAHYDLRYAFMTLNPTSARISEESTGLRWLRGADLDEWRSSSPSIERPVRVLLDRLKDQSHSAP